MILNQTNRPCSSRTLSSWTTSARSRVSTEAPRWNLQTDTAAPSHVQELPRRNLQIELQRGTGAAQELHEQGDLRIRGQGWAMRRTDLDLSEEGRLAAVGRTARPVRRKERGAVTRCVKSGGEVQQSRRRWWSENGRWREGSIGVGSGLALEETPTPCFFLGLAPGVWMASWSLAPGAGLGTKQHKSGETKPKASLGAQPNTPLSVLEVNLYLTHVIWLSPWFFVLLSLLHCVTST